MEVIAICLISRRYCGLDGTLLPESVVLLKGSQHVHVWCPAFSKCPMDTKV